MAKRDQVRIHEYPEVGGKVIVTLEECLTGNILFERTVPIAHVDSMVHAAREVARMKKLEVVR